MSEPVYEPNPVTPPPLSPPRADGSSFLGRALWMVVMIALFASVPWMAGEIQYHIRRGQLRAQHDYAVSELTELEKNAHLVALEDTSKAFRLVAQRIEPSVVHIDVVQVSETRGERDEFSNLLPGRPQPTQGQGSGVIIDADGYVLTNYHVVQGATDVRVNLSDGRTVNNVTIVGEDPLTDLAVLKINAGELTAAQWGDSDRLEVGDWVLAVGNPYGLDRTVTAGILGAKDRRGFAQGSAYQDFLQTDAAVNPGNSGGPLLNTLGQVIGINTAIVGPAFQGISFAIPSNSAREVYERLKAGGRVIRGWLGVAVQGVDEDLAVQLELPEPSGAVVANVLSGSPAEEAGLRNGDVVLSWDGTEVHDATELTLMIGKTDVGAAVDVEIWRNGEKRTLKVSVGERPSEDRLRR